MTWSKSWQLHDSGASPAKAALVDVVGAFYMTSRLSRMQKARLNILYAALALLGIPLVRLKSFAALNS